MKTLDITIQVESELLTENVNLYFSIDEDILIGQTSNMKIYLVTKQIDVLNEIIRVELQKKFSAEDPDANS